MNLCGNGGQERPHDRKKPRRLSVKIAAFFAPKYHNLCQNTWRLHGKTAYLRKERI